MLEVDIIGMRDSKGTCNKLVVFDEQRLISCLYLFLFSGDVELFILDLFVAKMTVYGGAKAFNLYRLTAPPVTSPVEASHFWSLLWIITSGIH